MGKTVVVYKSKTGFVQKYAEWLAEDLSADIFALSAVHPGVFEDYDTIIYGGSLYATGIIGLDFLKKNLAQLAGKKIVVFACGASPSNDELFAKLINHNFTADQQKQIKFFYLRRGFNFKKLPLFDKLLMTLLKWKMLLKKVITENLNSDETGMLEAYKKPLDFTQRRNIAPIVAYVNALFFGAGGKDRSKKNVRLCTD
jgi:menaquinone-dependent protoporphyrinogen IX oxidase